MKTLDNFSNREILNFQEAIEGLDNEIELYQDLLNSFFGQDGFSKDKLHNLIESNSLTEAASYAHLFKGSTGMLGAEQLYDALSDLDKVIRGKLEGNISEAETKVYEIYDKTVPVLKAKEKEISN